MHGDEFLNMPSYFVQNEHQLVPVMEFITVPIFLAICNCYFNSMECF